MQLTDAACFRTLDVELRPLTVAIGRNDTGKSTFLRALAGRVPGFRQENQPTRMVTPEPRRCLLVAPGNVGMTSAGVADGKAAPLPTGAGGGVPALVDWFLRNDRERFFAYVDAVKALVPGVTDIRIATPDPSTRRIDLVREGGWVTPADDASSGVRLLLLFLALAWHPSPPDLVLIEEPENGLHPERIREMMALLRGLTEGAHAPAPVQVVLTTHSPYVLSCVRIPQDQVLVFERHEDGSCGAKPLDPDRVRPFLDDFGLGEVWANEGEAGLVAP